MCLYFAIGSQLRALPFLPPLTSVYSLIHPFPNLPHVAQICLDRRSRLIQGDLKGAAQWVVIPGDWIYQGAAKEFGSAASDSYPQPHFRPRPQRTRSLPG